MKHFFRAFICTCCFLAAPVLPTTPAHADDGPSFEETTAWIEAMLANIRGDICGKGSNPYGDCVFDWAIEFEDCHWVFDQTHYNKALRKIFRYRSEIPYDAESTVRRNKEAERRLLLSTEYEVVNERGGMKECDYPCSNVKIQDNELGREKTQNWVSLVIHVVNREQNIGPRLTKAFQHLAKLSADRCEKKELF